jgi:putative FmdB family regulatory protein
MPMYDFQCTKCEHVFEEVTPSDAPPPVCPECGAASERQISAVQFRVAKRSKKAEFMQHKAKEEWKKSQGKT